MNGKQLLVCVTKDWTTFQATLYAFSRPPGKTDWELNFSVPAVLGSGGLGWGLGEHGWKLDEGPVKHEGDKKSPAGIFQLPSVFGYVSAAEAKVSSFPYLQLKPGMIWVDDPNSPFYNRMVDPAVEDSKSWRSAETMLRPDGAYRWGVVVAHNDPSVTPLAVSDKEVDSLPKPGSQPLGSCIFIHIWRSPESPTIGCTALSPDNMVKVTRWLKADDHPLLVQLPLPVYHRLLAAWNLPSLPASPKSSTNLAH